MFSLHVPFRTGINSGVTNDVRFLLTRKQIFYESPFICEVSREVLGSKNSSVIAFLVPCNSSCEYSNERSDSINGEEFEQLSDYKKHCVP